MSLLNDQHLYIIGASLLINFGFLIFILYNYRERKKIHTLLDDVNKSLTEKNQAISEQAARLEEAYENIWKINQRLEEEPYHRSDKINIQHRKLFEYIQFYMHKMRGASASMSGLLLLAQNEQMSQSLAELLELMNLCARQLDDYIRDFTQKVRDDL